MCTKNSCTCGKGNSCPVAYPTFPGSLRGYNGWSPLFSVVPDGGSREVLRLVGWFGGTGTTPTDYIGQYLSSTGFTTNIAAAENIKGSPGASDNTGWSEILVGDMTLSNIFGNPTGTVNSQDFAGKFILTGFNAGSTIAYKQIGKTMFMSYRIDMNATIVNEINAGFLVGIDILIPNGKIAQRIQVFDSLFCPSGIAPPFTSSLERAYTNTGSYNGRMSTTASDQYIHGLYIISNAAGGTTTRFTLEGALFFETD